MYQQRAERSDWTKEGNGGIHQRVREADFGAVDDAIAQGLDEDEEVVVAGVEDDLLE